MENYFRVTFRAQLVKFVLAFKADCQIDIFWKKGEKIAQSSKVPFNAIAHFNETLAISCNMAYDLTTKAFREKVTKFEIILYTEKGNKKVGEIRFDVAAYLNDRLKTPKEYELALDKCPDKNARLTFRLTAKVEDQISPDAISHSSEKTVNVETLVGGTSKSQIQLHPTSTILPTTTSQVPVKDSSSPRMEMRTEKRASTQSSIEVLSSRPKDGESASVEKNKDLQSENRKMRERLKGREKLLRENEELRKKIKNEEYESVRETKEKIEAGRKEVERLQATLKRQVLLEKEVKAIEDEIFKCKYQIMNAFNYANERGGGRLMFEMQEACGLKEL